MQLTFKTSQTLRHFYVIKILYNWLVTQGLFTIMARFVIICVLCVKELYVTLTQNTNVYIYMYTHDNYQYKENLFFKPLIVQYKYRINTYIIYMELYGGTENQTE